MRKWDWPLRGPSLIRVSGVVIFHFRSPAAERTIKLGADRSVSFIMDWRILLAERVRQFRDAVEMSKALPTLMQPRGGMRTEGKFDARWKELLERWKWNPLSARTVYCTPIGLVDLARDSTATLKLVVVAAWEREQLSRDNRGSGEDEDGTDFFDDHFSMMEVHKARCDQVIAGKLETWVRAAAAVGSARD